ncbi:MAG: hypothetical protein LBR20_06415 [Propionibacteriaceae bacterium]|jgi:hypothetical protein|nr:hypothetical protein [Propionibacteriaceae bacterium]
MMTANTTNANTDINNMVHSEECGHVINICICDLTADESREYARAYELGIEDFESGRDYAATELDQGWADTGYYQGWMYASSKSPLL